MKIDEYIEFLIKALPLGMRTMAVGKPGVGKTFGDMEACRRLEWDFIGLCAPLEDPSTIRGYPVPPKEAGGEATHCLFDGIAKAMRSIKPTRLLFDDLGMASDSTKRAIIRLVQFGELDGRKLPDHVVIGAATNDVGQGADVFGMLEPLKSRFHTIITVETDLDAVISHGLSKEWPGCLLAYLRNANGSGDCALHDWKPSKSMHIDGACPRGWEYVAKWVNAGIDNQEVIAGCVGKGRATQYLAFRALQNDLPDVDAVLLDPEHSPVPENPSAQYLVTMALAGRMDGGNFGQCVKYFRRMPAMFRALGIRDGLRAESKRRVAGTLPKGHQSISASVDWTSFAVSEDGRAIMGAHS